MTNLLKKMVYLDYSATTPCDPEVIHEIGLVLAGGYGNPSSSHLLGQQSAAIVFNARKYLSGIFHLQPQQVVFVSGGTESDNLALQGALRARSSKNHLVTTAVEHNAVAITCKVLERSGAKVSYVPVNKEGIVDLQRLHDAITPQTNVVSIIHVNNEMGAIQPLTEIGKVIRDKNKDVWFHTDAVQSFGKVQLPMEEAGLDLISISGHKIYGPVGIGALIMSPRVQLQPVLLGGKQEYGLRAGTENYVAVRGLHLATERFLEKEKRLFEQYKRLKTRFLKGIDNSPVEIISPKEGVPYIVTISSAKLPGAIAVQKFNELGIEVSAGSACGARSIKPSHVVLAMGYPREIAEGTVRFSFGQMTTEEEIDKAVQGVREVYGV